jgi:hypothetical protein
MRNRDSHLVYDSIPYDEVSELLPLSSLPSEAVVRDAAAVELVETVPDERILAVSPVSMATGYLLAQKPFTAVKFHHLSEENTLPELSDGYEVLVLGRPRDRRNHSLSEYA